MGVVTDMVTSNQLLGTKKTSNQLLTRLPTPTVTNRGGLFITPWLLGYWLKKLLPVKELTKCLITYHRHRN